METENNQNLTIKQRREQKRQEKLQKREMGENKQTKNRLFLWIGVAIVLIGAIIGMIKVVKNAPPTDPQSKPVNVLDSITSEDWTRGNTNASTTLTEYGDFECPACGDYYPLVKNLEAEFKDTARFVFRHFPLAQHANARLAARAAEAAGNQGKFWEMHDKLYETQDAWSGNAKAKSIFSDYAKALNLNMDQFTKDFESKQVGDKINSQYKSGEDFGVDATPTFYLNNTKISPKSFEEFKQLIQNEINKKP